MLNGSGTGRFSLEQLIVNELFSRSMLSRAMFGSDDRRDLYAEAHWPTQISKEQYQDIYERSPYAARVVELFPDESWQKFPYVYEDENAEGLTAFENAWIGLGQQLNGGETEGFQMEQGSPIYMHLHHLDTVGGIGRFGAMLIGFDDGKPLDQEVQAKANMGLLYLRELSEAQVQVVRLDQDTTSRRYSLPLEYSVTIGDPRNDDAVIGSSLTNVRVHWTRVLHYSTNGLTYCAPRMKQVYNELLDLQKIHAAGGEMCWQGSIPGLAMTTQPGVTRVDEAGLKAATSEFLDGFTRRLLVRGLNIQQLSPTVTDLSPHVLSRVQAVCIKLGVPMRKFLGSERGQLASGQDEDDLNGRLKHRQDFFLSPMLIAPLVSRLVKYGVLPKPKQYFVWWPDLATQSDAQKADVAAKRISAIAQYVTTGADALISPTDFLTRILWFNDAEARTILKNTANLAEADRVPAALDTVANARRAKRRKIIRHFRDAQGFRSEVTEE